MFIYARKKDNYRLPMARVHGLESYEQDCLPHHCLLDEGFSVPGGVGMGVSFFLGSFGTHVGYFAFLCFFCGLWVPLP
jgi:hypothetical protein